MAILKTQTEEREVPDGAKIQDAAEELGVPFGCHHGVCGACVTPVLEGMENLSEPSQEEADYELGVGDRMMCQCSIISGTVVLDVS